LSRPVQAKIPLTSGHAFERDEFPGPEPPVTCAKEFSDTSARTEAKQ